MKANIEESLRSLAVEIDSLNPDKTNARKHDRRSIDTIKESLREYGQRIPVVVQRQGRIVRAGNARLQAARELGWTHLAAVVVDDDDVAATAFAIMDNRSAELAIWERDQLADLLADLDAQDCVLPTGFDETELASMLADGDDRRLRPIDVSRPPPAMAWVLIGIPINRYGEIAGTVEAIASLDGVYCETTGSDTTPPEELMA